MLLLSLSPIESTTFDGRILEVEQRNKVEAVLEPSERLPRVVARIIVILPVDQVEVLSMLDFVADDLLNFEDVLAFLFSRRLCHGEEEWLIERTDSLKNG